MKVEEGTDYWEKDCGPTAKKKKPHSTLTLT